MEGEKKMGDNNNFITFLMTNQLIEILKLMQHLLFYLKGYCPIKSDKYRQLMGRLESPKQFF